MEVRMAGPGDDRRRQEILEATWQLIADRGYHAVRVADIAAVCGTSTGTIHYYFPGKQDVLAEALRYCVQQAFDRHQNALQSVHGARERLLRLIELQLPKPGSVRSEWLIWIQFWAEAALRPELQPVHNELYARWHETVLRLIRHGQSDGEFRDLDPDAATHRFTALTDGLAIQLLAGTPGMDLPRMRRLLVDFVDRELCLPPVAPVLARDGDAGHVIRVGKGA
jgi:AcrR family transcriptional regulator